MLSALGGIVGAGRSPHGERGLKSNRLVWKHWRELSLPPRGAWIEIVRDTQLFFKRLVAPPTGSVD